MDCLKILIDTLEPLSGPSWLFKFGCNFLINNLEIPKALNLLIKNGNKKGVLYCNILVFENIQRSKHIYLQLNFAFLKYDYSIKEKKQAPKLASYNTDRYIFVLLK